MGRSQFVYDVFVTALEGGCNYWAEIRDYHPFFGSGEDLIGFGAEVSGSRCDDVEDEDSIVWHAVNRDVIRRGIEIIMDRTRKLSDLGLGEATVQHLRKAIETNDAGDVDADGADVILQIGLFEKVVYA